MQALIKSVARAMFSTHLPKDFYAPYFDKLIKSWAGSNSGPYLILAERMRVASSPFVISWVTLPILFPPFWLTYRRLYAWALLYFIFLIILSIIGEYNQFIGMSSRALVLFVNVMFCLYGKSLALNQMFEVYNISSVSSESFEALNDEISRRGQTDILTPFLIILIPMLIMGVFMLILINKFGIPPFFNGFRLKVRF
jgi:hypothetical protein